MLNRALMERSANGYEGLLFRRGLYARYDKPLDRVDAGPLPIAGNWPGMAQIGFANRLDAALHWSGGKIVFFRGTRYVRYDADDDEVDEGFPLPIAEMWPARDGGYRLLQRHHRGHRPVRRDFPNPVIQTSSLILSAAAVP